LQICLSAVSGKVIPPAMRLKIEERWNEKEKDIYKYQILNFIPTKTARPKSVIFE
jgi:hypothetical protein